MEIRSFKMVTGEEVVARFNATLSNTATNKVISYKVEKPLVLGIHPSQGGMRLGFIPWTLSNDDPGELEIPAEAVILMFKPAPQVEKLYVQETTSIALTP